MAIYHHFNWSVYKARREELIQLIRQEHQEDGIVLLFGNFEVDGIPFKQDSSFLYYVGLEEPAAVLSIDCQTGDDVVYVANFGNERQKWVAQVIGPEQAQQCKLSAIEYLGQSCTGYQCHAFFSEPNYANLLAALQQWVTQGKKIYTLYPSEPSGYMQQRLILLRLATMVPDLGKHIIDISALVALMRRKKSNQEIEQIFKAVDITKQAHVSAAYVLEPEKIEYEVQAALEYVFTSLGARPAFDSIVASGRNSAVLHYCINNQEIKNGDLVVIDIGAQYNYYCADLTRTYPANGIFSSRQKELYTIVLECQDYIASLAKPGMWLSNAQYPDKSLHHLARQFFAKKGYEQYFLHGIGHFLGLDVHDVGSYAQPLQPGDVITIEPGLYLPQENIGIRIEDNYWIIENGNICLSEDLSKAYDEIQAMVIQKEETPSSTTNSREDEH